MSKRPRSPDASVTPARDADPDGDAFLQRLIAEQIQADTEDANPSSDVQEEILDNEDIFSIDTMDSLDDDVFSDAASMRPEHNLDVVLINDVSENEVSDNAPPPPRNRDHGGRGRMGRMATAILLLQHNRRRGLSISMWRISLTFPR